MKLRYWLLTVLYCGAIFYFSGRAPVAELDLGIDFGDKLLHMAAYAVMAGIVSVGIRRSNEQVSPRVQYFVPTAFAILYGATDEFHQSFVPTRHGDPLDFLADALGAVLAQVVLCRLVWRIPFSALRCRRCNPTPPNGIQ